ncbi:glycogen synthase [Streptomyces afghaniensis]|uniref:glycogen synthase n=1 Tax=Streptomyces TaxID=1883 RepID=UPI001FAF150A|nr:glycogen/starch synthase [Streptomyces sp. HP-A2021]UOB12703.1 glycogen synthase [Streptomyces sp. HP-A2021]
MDDTGGPSMKCLYITQERAPFFSEGGLGQASRTLPELLQRDHAATHDIILPCYPWLVSEAGLRTEQVTDLPQVTVAGKTVRPSVERLLDHGGANDVYLVRADAWFGRAGIYRDADYVEFADAAHRAAFFGWCVARWVELGARAYDLVHGNDWQSGAAMAHLRSMRGTDRSPALLMNVHNGAYQGALSSDSVATLALPQEWQDSLPRVSRGAPSLLLLGLLAADAATTGSMSYAAEMADEFAGTPLGAALEALSPKGIIAGVDTSVWDPQALGRTTHPYAKDTVDEGKKRNKRALQSRLGLVEHPGIPLFGLCARLVEDKGIDLVIDAMTPLLGADSAQLVVIGPGEVRFRDALVEIGSRYPGRVHLSPRFDQGLAWQVYAGSDFTLMPSRFEPCGLNQLIAMRYGTIPVVTDVGGLGDTVVDLVTDPVRGTGFHIAHATAEAVQETVVTASQWLHRQPAEVRAVRERLMQLDWSWSRTAQETARLYHRTINRRLPTHRRESGSPRLSEYSPSHEEAPSCRPRASTLDSPCRLTFQA